MVTKKSEPETSAISNTDNTSVNTVGWAGAHYQMLQSLNMRNEILLNTAKSTSLFGNKEYVASIQESNVKLGLNINGGPIFTTKTASVDNFGKVSYNKNLVANIFSFAEMRKQYRVNYNSETEDAFIVRTPERQVRFKPLKNGLYSLNPKKETHHQTTDGRFQLVNTLEDKKKFFPQGNLSEPKPPEICFILWDVHP